MVNWATAPQAVDFKTLLSTPLWHLLELKVVAFNHVLDLLAMLQTRQLMIPLAVHAAIFRERSREIAWTWYHLQSKLQLLQNESRLLECHKIILACLNVLIEPSTSLKIIIHSYQLPFLNSLNYFMWRHGRDFVLASLLLPEDDKVALVHVRIGTKIFKTWLTHTAFCLATLRNNPFICCSNLKQLHLFLERSRDSN